VISAGGLPAGSILTTRILLPSSPQPLTKAGHCWNWVEPAGGVSGSGARANLDVETGLFVKAFILCHHEAGVRPLVDPIEAHADLPLGLRVSRASERQRGETRDAGTTEKLTPGGRSIVWHQLEVSIDGVGRQRVALLGLNPESQTRF
jgi:hypothetical protein